MNLLAAESAIIAQLVAETTGFATIGTASRLALADDLTLDAPAAYVIPGDAEASAATLFPESITERQRWQVVVMVKHLPAESPSASTALAAGDLCATVMTALAGFMPGPGYTTLVYAGRDPASYDIGLARFPLLFDCYATVPVL